MKKLLTILLAAICCVCSVNFCGCISGEKYTFVAPDGAPAIALSKLIYDKDKLSTGRNVDYKIVSSKEIQTYLAAGTAEFILAPVNLASKLYKASSQSDHYVMAAVITHGNFYIISREQITVSDLSNKQIAVPMQGAVPDWTLQMALNKNNVVGATFNYYSDASQIVPMILTGQESIGLIPEPAATALTKKASTQQINLYRLDLQELYDSQTKAYPQAVLMVKKSVLENNAQLRSALENKINDSVSWAKTNIEDAVNCISNVFATTLTAAALSAQVIDACNIYYQSASAAKNSVISYINGIIEIDASKATAVQNDFFYIPQ